MNSDIGKLKVSSLANRLRAINPNASIQEMPIYLDENNATDIVSQAAIIFDTIDFLDLSAVIALHDEARRQKKAVISGMNVGWGACILHFPPEGSCSYRTLFDLPPTGSVKDYAYCKQFLYFIKKVSHLLPEEVKQATEAGLRLMADGTPCPMMQVGAGVACLAGLAVTVLVRLVAGLPVVAAPKAIYINLGQACELSDFRARA